MKPSHLLIVALALALAASAQAGAEFGEPYLAATAVHHATGNTVPLAVDGTRVYFEEAGEAVSIDLSTVIGASHEADRLTVHTASTVTRVPANLLRSYVATEEDQEIEMKDYTFTVPSAAQEWSHAVRKAALGLPMTADLPSRRALVMVNPRSGDGKAEQAYAKVEPILTKAGFTLTKHVSTKGKDTRKTVEHASCGDYDYIVSIGGDGTLNKMIRGMFQKEDFADCLEKWVFHAIPSGSGNGLATNLMLESGVKFGIEQAALMMTRAEEPGMVNTVDLMAYDTTFNGTDQFGFLSAEFALAADLDKESEIYRFLGKERFDISGFIRTLFLRRYKARFEYLPADQPLTGEGMKGTLVPLDKPVPANWVTLEDSYVMIYVCQMPWMASTALVAPDVKIGDGVASILLLPGSAGRWDVLKMLLGYSDGSHIKKVKSLKVVHGKAFRLTPLDAGTKDLPGFIGIDGDFVPPQPVQGQLNKGVLKFIYSHSKK